MSASDVPPTPLPTPADPASLVLATLSSLGEHQLLVFRVQEVLARGAATVVVVTVPPESGPV